MLTMVAAKFLHMEGHWWSNLASLHHAVVFIYLFLDWGQGGVVGIGCFSPVCGCEEVDGRFLVLLSLYNY